jgi:peptidyl-tRNA hydrolase
MKIFVRGDVQYGTKGKVASQVAHAAVGVIMQFFQNTRNHYEGDVPQAVHEWLQGDFAKIVCSVKDLPAMLQLKTKAEEKGIPTKLIVDNASTVFDDKTVTALAIGPANSEDIDPFTGPEVCKLL